MSDVVLVLCLKTGWPVATSALGKTCWVIFAMRTAVPQPSWSRAQSPMRQRCEAERSHVFMVPDLMRAASFRSKTTQRRFTRTGEGVDDD
jgi:hypothetical protein